MIRESTTMLDLLGILIFLNVVGFRELELYLCRRALERASLQKLDVDVQFFELKRAHNRLLRRIVELEDQRGVDAS